MEEFIAAAYLMGVPGENFIVAEVSGGIAKQVAVKLPRRPASPLNEIVSRPADVRLIGSGSRLAGTFRSNVIPPATLWSRQTTGLARDQLPVGFLLLAPSPGGAHRECS